MLDVMVDLETGGTSPEHAQIVQLSAWKFDLRSGEIGDCFNIAVAPMAARFWDLSTILWWKEDPARVEHLNSLMRDAIDPRTAFKAFAGFVADGEPGERRMWAKPAHFEFPFLEHAYRQLGLENPFHYRYCRDVNSFLAGLHRGPEHVHDAVDLPFEGMPHNALWDSLHECRVLLKATEGLRS